mmetsp:Transcript_15211/g.25003  ORF Transcript_15211/g.25003 Transcript_15211/m.25003 type:complete len:99 (+) Transcript_15211:164-460(+)
MLLSGPAIQSVLSSGEPWKLQLFPWDLCSPILLLDDAIDSPNGQNGEDQPPSKQLHWRWWQRICCPAVLVALQHSQSRDVPATAAPPQPGFQGCAAKR